MAKIDVTGDLVRYDSYPVARLNDKVPAAEDFRHFLEHATLPPDRIAKAHILQRDTLIEEIVSGMLETMKKNATANMLTVDEIGYYFEELQDKLIDSVGDGKD